MSTIESDHLERLRSRTLDRYKVSDIPKWIEENTMLAMKPFSFKDHEYQQKILSDTSQELVIRKCSQVGLTEATMRAALAACAIRDNFTIIYTLPTATLVGLMFSPRVDSVMVESPKLKALMSSDSVDNKSLKEIGSSKMYMQGSASGRAPISIPADMLIHDEIDFSDQSIIEQYQSRLTHSEYKIKHKFSTPTVPDYGIDYEFQNSRRHFNFVRCNHCTHFFIPDYYQHIHIPEFKGDLKDITKANLGSMRWREAVLLCPKCGKEPSLQIEHREWVCENPNDHFVAAGYQVSPFDAPNIIKPSYLVQASTTYDRRSQFDNFNLGLPVADKQAALEPDELRAMILRHEKVSGGTYVLGLDMGNTCHAVVASVRPDGTLLVVHTEKIPMTRVRERRAELARQYWPRITVVDMLPLTETVYSMQMEDQNLFAAVYVNRNSIETFQVRERDEDDDKAEEQLRQVNINRNVAFDALMEDVRESRIKKLSDENDDEWVDQLQDMKRVQKLVKDGNLAYTWEKSGRGDDHFHHALLYARTASKMLGIGSFRGGMLPLVSTFKNKSK